MARTRPTRGCAAPGCGQPIPHPRVMCRRHWALLPDALCAAITNSVRAGRRADLAANLRRAEQLLGETDEPAAAA